MAQKDPLKKSEYFTTTSSTFGRMEVKGEKREPPFAFRPLPPPDHQRPQTYEELASRIAKLRLDKGRLEESLAQASTKEPVFSALVIQTKRTKAEAELLIKNFPFAVHQEAHKIIDKVLEERLFLVSQSHQTHYRILQEYHTKEMEDRKATEDLLLAAIRRLHAQIASSSVSHGPPGTEAGAAKDETIRNLRASNVYLHARLRGSAEREKTFKANLKEAADASRHVTERRPVIYCGRDQETREQAEALHKERALSASYRKTQLDFYYDQRAYVAEWRAPLVAFHRHPPNLPPRPPQALLDLPFPPLASGQVPLANCGCPEEVHNLLPPHQLPNLPFRPYHDPSHI